MISKKEFRQGLLWTLVVGLLIVGLAQTAEATPQMGGMEYEVQNYSCYGEGGHTIVAIHPSSEKVKVTLSGKDQSGAAIKWRAQVEPGSKTQYFRYDDAGDAKATLRIKKAGETLLKKKIKNQSSQDLCQGPSDQPSIELLSSRLYFNKRGIPKVDLVIKGVYDTVDYRMFAGSSLKDGSAYKQKLTFDNVNACDTWLNVQISNDFESIEEFVSHEDSHDCPQVGGVGEDWIRTTLTVERSNGSSYTATVNEAGRIGPMDYYMQGVFLAKGDGMRDVLRPKRLDPCYVTVYGRTNGLHGTGELLFSSCEF